MSVWHPQPNFHAGLLPVASPPGLCTNLYLTKAERYIHDACNSNRNSILCQKPRVRNLILHFFRAKMGFLKGIRHFKWLQKYSEVWPLYSGLLWRQIDQDCDPSQLTIKFTGSHNWFEYERATLDTRLQFDQQIKSAQNGTKLKWTSKSPLFAWSKGYGYIKYKLEYTFAKVAHTFIVVDKIQYWMIQRAKRLLGGATYHYTNISEKSITTEELNEYW